MMESHQQAQIPMGSRWVNKDGEIWEVLAVEVRVSAPGFTAPGAPCETTVLAENHGNSHLFVLGDWYRVMRPMEDPDSGGHEESGQPPTDHQLAAAGTYTPITPSNGSYWRHSDGSTWVVRAVRIKDGDPPRFTPRWVVYAADKRGLLAKFDQDIWNACMTEDETPADEVDSMDDMFWDDAFLATLREVIRLNSSTDDADLAHGAATAAKLATAACELREQHRQIRTTAAEHGPDVTNQVRLAGERIRESARRVGESIRKITGQGKDSGE